MSACIKTLQKSRLHFTFSLLVGIGLLIAYDTYSVFKCQGHTSLFISFRYIMRSDAMLRAHHQLCYLGSLGVSGLLQIIHPLPLCRVQCMLCKVTGLQSHDTRPPRANTSLSSLCPGNWSSAPHTCPSSAHAPIHPLLLWHGELEHLNLLC